MKYLSISSHLKKQKAKIQKMVQGGAMYYVKVATSSSTRLVGVLLFDSISTFQKLNHCNLTMLKMS
jgi:hypothetical protein